MYKQLQSNSLLEAAKRMPSIIGGTDEKGNYRIHKVAENRFEVHIESNKNGFRYRVHILVTDNYAVINPAGNYLKGKFYPIYPQPRATVLDSALNYSFDAFKKEARNYMPKRRHVSSKSGIQLVRGHNVGSYRRKNGTWVKGFTRGDYTRMIK